LFFRDLPSLQRPKAVFLPLLSPRKNPQVKTAKTLTVKKMQRTQKYLPKIRV
jgi:hypothetical protein